MLAAPVASDRLTSDWQLTVVPTRPEYWMATPTECRPLLSRVVSSTIQCSTLPHRRHDPAEHPLAHGAILPIGFADEMLDRLVAARDVPAVQPLGDRLHALALTGQQQPGHVVAQPTPTRIVAHNRAQILEIVLEAPLQRGIETRSFAHAN